jgi:hypothetical protein
MAADDQLRRAKMHGHGWNAAFAELLRFAGLL